MSTFMLKNSATDFTPVNNVFIDKYMLKARGEFVKVYILLLKYSMSGEPGISSSILSAKLNLLESDIMNALSYWNEEGVIKLNPIDKMNNFNIEFVDLVDTDDNHKNNIDLLSALSQNNNTDMLRDIENLIGRTLSPSEMSNYLSWQTEFNFSSELILILIEYCLSRGKNDSRYFEKVALSWFDAGVKTIDDAQDLITKHEDKWVKIRHILNYIGIKNNDIMKPQQDMIEKWLFEYNFSMEVILKACDICSQRLNRADFRYIDGILTKWKKDNLYTLEDIATKDVNKTPQIQTPNYKPNNFYNKNKSSNSANFTQREYDYDKLEKQLLGWDEDDDDDD